MPTNTMGPEMARTTKKRFSSSEKNKKKEGLPKHDKKILGKGPQQRSYSGRRPKKVTKNSLTRTGGGKRIPTVEKRQG